MSTNNPSPTFVSRTRAWAKRNPFLRSVGFEVPFIFGSSFDDGEKPKVIVRTSWPLALARCGIHILPILVSITVLILILGNSYLGRGLPGSIIDPSINIALLQITAKIQELLIVASTTTIVMHVLRVELTTGQGLPLGHIGGGFLYTGLGYFWSPEFWGSFYTPWSKGARFRVFAIKVVGGLMASLAGPSTAVLLIPRDQPWPAGGTGIFMPGPTDNWWPTSINLNNSVHVQNDTSQHLDGDIRQTIPMTSNVWSVSKSVDILGQKAYLEGSSRNLTSGFIFGPSTVDIPSQVDSIRSFRYHGNHRGYSCETVMWGPRAANAIVQARVRQDWIDEAFAIPYQFLKYGPSRSEYKYFGSMEVSTTTLVPATRVACLPAQIVPYSQNDVQFPRLSDSPCWTATDTYSVNVSSNIKTFTDRLCATWLSVPKTVNRVSRGLVLEMPSMANETSRAIVTCSLDSRWTNGTVTTYHLENANDLEKLARSVVVSTALLKDPVPASGWSPGYSDFEPVIKNHLSQSINLNDSWLRSLAQNTGTNDVLQNRPEQECLEDVLTNLDYVGQHNSSVRSQMDMWNGNTVGFVNRTVGLEWWLALLVTDGLSQFGLAVIFNMTGPRLDWALLNYVKGPSFRDRLFDGKNALLSPNFTHIINERIDITIGGYSYKAGSVTDYASAGLLLVHILLALAHTTYTVWWTNRSSCAWDTLTELMVLMQNSRPPATLLSNTSAGITDIKTYSRKARIMAIRSADRPGGTARVELIFDGDHNVGLTGPFNQPNPGHLLRSRRLESLSSVTSRSPLLSDPDTLQLQDISNDGHDCRETSVERHHQWILERVVADEKYS